MIYVVILGFYNLDHYLFHKKIYTIKTMVRTNQDLQRLFPISVPTVLTRAKLEDIIDNRMWIDLDYHGLSPGSNGVTIGRNMKITTIGNLITSRSALIYFRGWQYDGPSISAGFIRAQWRLFLLSRSLLVTWRGAYWTNNPPGYLNTDRVLNNLYNLSNNP